MNKLFSNKKGSIQDLILIVGVLLFFALVILIGFKVSSVFNQNIQGMSGMPQEAKTSSSKLTGYFPTVIDGSFLFVAIGMCIVTLVFASLVRIHPMFIAFFFVGLLFIVFIAGLASNIYQNLAADPMLSAEASQLLFTTSILTKLPIFISIIGLILMVVSYKTWQNG